MGNLTKFKPTEVNYTPVSISFSEGFLGPKGDLGHMVVADKIKMKSIVSQLQQNGRNISHAECGLLGDWDCTVFLKYSDGDWEYTEYGFEESIWAKPALIVYFQDGPSEMYECFTIGEKTS